MSARDDALLSYVESELPPGATIADYRRARALTATSERRRLGRRVRALLLSLTRRRGRGPSAEGGTP